MSFVNQRVKDRLHLSLFSCLQQHVSCTEIFWDLFPVKHTKKILKATLKLKLAEIILCCFGYKSICDVYIRIIDKYFCRGLLRKITILQKEKIQATEMYSC